ncbi:hypothetical protein D3C80_877210 [compost metagenome]
MGAQVAAVQLPVVAARLLAVGCLDQRQGAFGEVRGDAGVNHFDLAGAALEGCVQAPAQHIEVALVGAAAGVLGAGELAEEAITEVKLGHQLTPLDGNLLHFPLAAAVQQGQLALVPAPLVGQALQQPALPAMAAALVAELLVHLQVQAASYQLQARGFAALQQVTFDAPVDHHVGVQLVEVELVGKYCLLVVQAQAAHRRVFAGVGFGQQQFEQRFVGRVDAFEQLPQASADELTGRNVRQVAEVKGFLAADKALGQQRLGVAVVVVFLVHRYQPPQRRTPGQPQGGAVELVQQQVVLGGAAVVGAELAIALTLGEALCVDQEKVCFGAQACRPGLQQLALAAQLTQQLFGQAGCMAHPQVHVAVLGLRQRAQAAHQEQAVDRAWRVAMAGLVGERAGQALGLDHQLGTWLVARHASRCATRDVARQQRMVHVKQQRQ